MYRGIFPLYKSLYCCMWSPTTPCLLGLLILSLNHQLWNTQHMFVWPDSELTKLFLRGSQNFVSTSTWFTASVNPRILNTFWRIVKRPSGSPQQRPPGDHKESTIKQLDYSRSVTLKIINFSASNYLFSLKIVKCLDQLSCESFYGHNRFLLK